MEIERSAEKLQFVTTMTVTVTANDNDDLGDGEEEEKETEWVRVCVWEGEKKRVQKRHEQWLHNGVDGMIKNYLLEQQPFPSETEVYELLPLIV